VFIIAVPVNKTVIDICIATIAAGKQLISSSLYPSLNRQSYVIHYSFNCCAELQYWNLLVTYKRVWLLFWC